jgi:hypothetical protein
MLMNSVFPFNRPDGGLSCSELPFSNEADVSVKRVDVTDAGRRYEQIGAG